jgi:D-Ala-D-Ala carboxypeptidase 3 (S13) family protein
MNVMKSRTRSIKIFLVSLLLLAVPGILPAQEPVKQQSTPPAGNPAAPQSATPQPAQTTTDEGLMPVYGLQGVLIETLDGKTVSAQSVDQAFNPASSIKLATALVALHNFGPQHRFTTGFWTNGYFDKANGTIQGNLYVSGRDPSFHYEHAVMIARQLNRLGIRTVSGDLIVAPGFTMNFNSSARRSGELLYDTLDTMLRPSEATRAWTYERMALGDQSSLQDVPSVAVMGEVVVGSGCAWRQTPSHAQVKQAYRHIESASLLFE